MVAVKNGKVRTLITLPAEVYELIERIAIENDRSRAWVMTNGMTHWVNSYMDNDLTVVNKADVPKIEEVEQKPQKRSRVRRKSNVVTLHTKS